jgi:hypothetical protein
MTETDLTGAALALAREGVPVFPVGLDKTPRVAGGFQAATTNPEQIEAWKWEAIGAAVGEGQLIVDIDPRNGGDKAVEAFQGVGLDLPETRTVATKSGGLHLYYWLKDDLAGRKFRKALAPGIDVKAPGKGYVVVPPSPGYVVVNDSDVAQAPQWVLDEVLVPEHETEVRAPGKPKFFEQFELGTAYGRAAMERELGRLVTTAEGGRNDALNRATFSLSQLVAGGELAEDQVREALETAGERMGLEPREIQVTIASAWQAGEREPRQAPEQETSGDPFRPPEAVIESLNQDEDRFWLAWDEPDPGPPPFYLWPLVPRNAYVLVYGATEASKSMVFLGLAAEGSRRGLKTTIYSLENPAHIDADRARRFGPDPANLRITNQSIDLGDDRQVQALVERESAWPDGGKTDWLIIDTYSHAYSSRSEDGNARAIEFARRIRWVMSQVGCSVILLDHTGYADHGEPRDASAKRQQVDVAIKMARPEGYKWEPGKDAPFVMENHKAARFGNPFRFAGSVQDVKPDRGLKLHWISAPGFEWRDEA